MAETRHGMRRLVAYAPETGASVSALCEGEKLRAVSIYEEHGEVGIADYRVSATQPLRSTRD